MTESLSVSEKDTTDNGRIVENRPPTRKLSADGIRPSQQPVPHIDAPGELVDVVFLVPQTVLDGGEGCCHRKAEDTESHIHKPACAKPGVYEPQPLLKIESKLSVDACADCFPVASPTLTPERCNGEPKHKCWLCAENVPVSDFVAHLASCGAGEGVAVVDGI